jgi:WD40 repeat protein
MRTLILLPVAVLLVAAAPFPKRTDRHGDPLPVSATARLGTVRWRHPAPVHAVVYSPDGRFIATRSQGRAIHLWQASTGKELFRFKASYQPGFPATTVAFSADSKMLAAICNYRIGLWDTTTGKELRRLPCGAAGGVAFSPNGKTVAAIYITREIEITEVATGKEVARFKSFTAPRGEPLDLAFSPDGTKLAVIERDGLYLRDAATGRVLQTLRRHRADFGVVAFSSDGTLASASGNERVIRLWDFTTGKMKRVLSGHPEIIVSLSFSRDGKRLVSASYQDFRVWDVAGGKLALTKPGFARLGCGPVALSPDGKTVAQGTANLLHKLVFWDVATGKEIDSRPGHAFPVGFVAFAPGGKVVTCGRPFGSAARVWDQASGKQVRLLEEKGQAIQHAALSPGGKLAATVRRDGTVSLWDLATGKRKGTLRALADSDRVSCLAFSPDGKTLAVGDCLISRDYHCTVALLDVASGKQVRQWQVPGAGLASVEFSPDGKVLVTMGADFRLWDPASGAALPNLPRPPKFTPGVFSRFSSDGALLAVADHPKSFTAWDVPARRCLGRFGGEDGPVRSLAFSPDGRLLACGLQDGSVELWETLTWTVAGRRQGPRGRVHSVAFSADGKTLASGHEDTTVLLWDVAALWRPGCQVGPLTAARLEALWTQLGSEKADEAWRAVATLAQARRQSMTLMQKRLRSALPLDKSLLADLDSDEFAVREKASQEIARLGVLAEPALRQALKEHSSPEVRLRVRRLLERLASAQSRQEQLRELRGVAVLERIGSVEARALLRRLASGMADARLTRDAKAALRRLKR